MHLSGYFIRTKSEYTGFNMDVGIVTVLSNYIVRVLKQPGSIVYMSPPFKHSALGVFFEQRSGSSVALNRDVLQERTAPFFIRNISACQLIELLVKVKGTAL